MEKILVHTWEGKKEITDKTELKGKFYEIGEVDKQGLQQGIWKNYNPQGRLYLEATMKDGKAIGNQVQYNKDGSKFSEGAFEEGRQMGTHKHYKNGVVVEVFNYIKGKRHGEQLYYNLDGTLKRKYYYIMGKSVSKEQWENRD